MAAYIATHERSVLPKRYEDTKVSITQSATHEDILVIGNTIYQKIIDKNESKHDDALAAVEGRIWSIAADEKDKALKEAKEIAENQLETAMAAAKKAQEKAVKAESKRVEALMKKIAAQQVQQEKDEGDRRQGEAVMRAREECEKEKLAAVEVAKGEVKLAAEEQARKVAGQEEEKRKAVALAAEKEKQNALKVLKGKLHEHEQQAVQETKEKCEKEAEKRLQQLEEKHLEEIKLLEEEITEKDSEKEIVIKELDKERELRNKVQERFHELVKEFQNFIDTTGPFEKGQSDFMLTNFIQDIPAGPE